ncbi:U3 small nucleolar RNA-associated protein 8 [Lipomyces japonicus]|uniref:U3 small nucleolar RNA-associated protein 8 n=1 Tax=Lipomyces japonicus TaxID=56871 RepID=UPI0034CE5067
MSSISAPFTVHAVPSDSLSLKSVHVSAPKSTTIDLAVTAAGVYRYTLRPAPRFLSSIAVSPLAELLCPVAVVNNGNLSDGLAAFAAIRERKRNVFLRRISENGQVIEKEVDGEIVGLTALTDNSSSSSPSPLSSQFVVVVFKTGKVVGFKIERQQENDAETFVQVWSVRPYDNASEVVFAHFANDKKEGHYLLLVARGNESVLDIRKLALTFDSGVQTARWDVVARKDKLEQLQYHESGILFRLLESASVEILTLATMSRTTLDLTSFIQQATSNSHSNNNHKNFKSALPALSYVPVSKSAILVSTGSKLVLINWTYKIVLASVEIGTGTDSFTLLRRIGKRAAVGITKNGQVQVVGFIVGTGKLLECVTGKVKSIPQNETPSLLASILFKEHYSARKYKIDVENNFESSRKEYDHIISQLKLLKDRGDVNAWESRVIPYLTGKEWVDVESTETTSINKPKNKKSRKSLSEPPVTTANATDLNDNSNTTKSNNYTSTNQVYYRASNARQVDPALISAIVDLLFEITTKGGIILANFFPENTIFYLLGHPLFPTTRLPNLLALLADKPLLLSHAIRNTSALSSASIVGTLSKTLAASEIATATHCIVRLISDYSYPSIVSALQQNHTASELEQDINALLGLIEAGLEDGAALNIWNIITCYVDACGLFSLKPDLIGRLSDLVSGVIADLQGRLELLHVVDTALYWARKKKSRTSLNPFTSHGFARRMSVSDR